MCCDRCCARAYVHVILDSGGELAWCGHHFAQFEEALFAYSIVEVDQRHLIDA